MININRLQSQAAHAKAARASMLIVWNYYRQVIDKNQHVKNALNLVRQLADLMHAREHAHAHQLKDIDNSIKQIRNDLNKVRARTRMCLIGGPTGTEPAQLERNEWDWDYCENVADEYIYCDALVSTFSTQQENLSRMIYFLRKCRTSAGRGDTTSLATIEGLAKDISKGIINIWNAESHSAYLALARSLSIQRIDREFMSNDLIFGNCLRYLPSQYLAFEHHSCLARKTGNGRARIVRCHHGAAKKAGDDGDGGDGDGEPPRPRSSQTPTPPLNHSLTHSLTIAGGVQW
ncbi:hypothetical protein NR402_13820 [Acidithiobacillus ferrooxidans]|uniref:hypothetical protein n=1 Tax=Acidithiobacillus ferrooxidans TaxID=920 RepID=UPI00214CB89A|nr:hypothetical protein [Acidithiobacillus ferrooxidans]MCR2831349.1 hypothetical protein [Acidithiobacillus ferrooxidans]